MSCHYTYHDPVFFFKQKTAYELRISDWSSDVCSSDLQAIPTCCCRLQCRNCLACYQTRRTLASQIIELIFSANKLFNEHRTWLLYLRPWSALLKLVLQLISSVRRRRIAQ